MADAGTVKFVTTLPLGSLSPMNRKAGYLSIEGKRLTHVVMKDFSRKQRRGA